MSKTTNKFSPEVCDRAVRMVFDHERDHSSRWAAVESIAAKIGCVPQTLQEWVKKAEVTSSKRRHFNGCRGQAEGWSVRTGNSGRPTRFFARPPRILLEVSSTARSSDDRLH